MAVFNQSFRDRLGAVWGTRQEKGTVFESRWRFFGKKKIWFESIPAATERSVEQPSGVFRDYLAGGQDWVERGGGLESGRLSEGLYVEARRQDGKPCQKSSILDWGIGVAC